MAGILRASKISFTVARPAASAPSVSAPGSIRFTVPGNPIPWKRPRANGRRHFTPQDVLDAERMVGLCARKAGAGPVAGPVRLRIALYRDSSRHVDWDNLAKLVCDGLNGVAFLDDSQIVECHVTKGVDRANPRTEVEIEEVA